MMMWPGRHNSERAATSEPCDSDTVQSFPLIDFAQQDTSVALPFTILSCRVVTLDSLHRLGLWLPDGQES